MNLYPMEGPTGALPIPPAFSTAVQSLQASSIPITPDQLTQLDTILFSLNTQAQAYIDNPNVPNSQALAQVLLQLYALLSDYAPNGSFPYTSVAYIQFLCLEVQSVIEEPLTNNQLPVQEGQIPLMLQQLYNVLETFIQELIIPSPAEYNRLLNYITNGIAILSLQPVTAAIGIPPDQPQVLLNFLTGLQTTTTAFFANPTPATNQDLQNLLNAMYVFFRDFQVPGYTQYAKFITTQIVIHLNDQPLCMGTISQLLQQLYSELATFMERLIMDETIYEQLATLLAQCAANSTVCAGTGPTGATGPIGPTGASGTTQIPITPAQITQFTTLLQNLNIQVQAYVTNPNAPNPQNLQQSLLQLYNFFTDYVSFPYESVAYTQFLLLELNDMLSQPRTDNLLPIQEGQIPLTLQQLYTALETFVTQLILDPATYNQYLTFITDGIAIVAVRPVTAAIGIPPDQPQVLVNFFTGLQTTTNAFFANPTPATNQDLQNLLNALYVFFRDFQVPGYTQYAKFITTQIVIHLNDQPLCMGTISQLLQQLYAELANFMERLIMDETIYEQLATLLAQCAANSTICSGGGGTGPTGATGPSGPTGPTGPGSTVTALRYNGTSGQALALNQAVSFNNTGYTSNVSVVDTTAIRVLESGFYYYQFLCNVGQQSAENVMFIATLNGNPNTFDNFPLALSLSEGLYVDSAVISMQAGDVFSMINGSSGPVTLASLYIEGYRANAILSLFKIG